MEEDRDNETETTYTVIYTVSGYAGSQIITKYNVVQSRTNMIITQHEFFVLFPPRTNQSLQGVSKELGNTLHRG